MSHPKAQPCENVFYLKAMQKTISNRESNEAIGLLPTAKA